MALPYTVFSIYYQWRVARQWCVLCLCVQVLLLLGGINVFTTHLLTQLQPLSVTVFAKSLLCYLLPLLAWYSIKPYLLNLQKAKTTQREYLRIKFNTEIFETLLKKQKKITLPTDGLGIDIGNLNATNTIIKVCNPYCGPCSDAHSKIEKLLLENKNVQVQILFMTPDNPGDRIHTTASHLLAIAKAAPSRAFTQQALNDWYLPSYKDYNAFAAKYPLNGQVAAQEATIAIMVKWCIDNNILDTPTIFFNGHELPTFYDLEDLQYFLQE